MKEKSIELIYLTLASFMLVLLQTAPFQNAIGFVNIIGIPYLGEIIFYITSFLSFVGAILFIFSSIKLILITLKRD